MEKIDWLWPGWLARGKFHLLAGGKGAGKSTICFDLMARLTSGGQWPDGKQAPIGDALIWSGEDGIGDTILPRFAAAGGDLERIYPIKYVIEKGFKRRAFDPSTDISALIALADQLPDLGMIVIDPIVLAVPAQTDSHRNAETRRGLQPLVDLAEHRNTVLIGISHFAKGTNGQEPIERVAGSLAFGALPRVVLGAAADQDGVQRRLVRVASNIGPNGGGIEYTLFQAPLVDHDFTAQRVDWGRFVNGSPKELLNAEKQSAEAQAGTFLTEFLGDTPKPQKDVKEAADAFGHSWATVRRAKEKLGIKPQKGKDAWLWQLPTPPNGFGGR